MRMAVVYHCSMHVHMLYVLVHVICMSACYMHQYMIFFHIQKDICMNEYIL
jgi:hypothetical protein